MRNVITLEELFMNKQKRDGRAREVPDFVRRATDYIDTSWPVRMGRRLDACLSSLDDAYMRKNSGTSFFGLLGERIGLGVTVLSFIVLGLWLLSELGIL